MFISKRRPPLPTGTDKGATIRSAAAVAYRQVVTLTRSNERSRTAIATSFLARDGSFSPSPINLHFQQNLNKDDTIGKQECRGSKREGERGGGWGGGGVETNHIWSKDSQWLFNWEHALGSIWTVTFRACLHKSDAPLKGPLNWQLFLALCGAGQGPKTLISLGRDGKERSYTLKTHGVPSVLAFVPRLAGHCSCSSQEDNERAATGLVAPESNSKRLPMQN